MMQIIPKRTTLLLILAGLGMAYALPVLFAVPSHDRSWKPEFAVLPEIARDGYRVTVRNIRDWRYNADGPVSMRWSERDIYPHLVERVWLVVEPFEKWDAIAHTFLIFDFKGTEPLVFSIEARGEVGEEYSPLAGATRHYELAYLFGAEQDFLVRRAVTLDHPLFLYPLTTSDGFPERLLSDLLDATDELSRTPRFYNTFLHNCTSALAASANRATPKAIPWDLSFILPGYSSAHLQKLGYIPDAADTGTGMSRYRIDDIVRGIADSEDFLSELRIRSAARRGF